MIQIKEQLIPIGHPNRCGQKITPIAVVIHYTANDSPSATDTANVNYASRSYKNINGTSYEHDGITKFRFGSAHWYIDRDSATLAIPQNEVAWGCGDRELPYENGYKGQTKIAQEIFNHRQNYLTISYELCNNLDWNIVCDNSIEIIAKDMIKYNISTNMIFRHHDISGKCCPKPFVDNEQAWINYKNKLIKKVIELKTPSLTYEKAIDILVQNKIISSPTYWLANNQFIDGKFAIIVLTRLTKTTNISDAIKSLLNNKIISDLKYWTTNCVDNGKVSGNFMKVVLLRCVDKLI